MQLYLQAALLAFAVSAGGTGLGVLLAVAVRRITRILSSALLGFAAGIILSLVLLDMLPEAWETGGPAPFFAGLAGGMIVLVVVMKKSHGEHAHEVNDEEAREIVKNNSLVQTGLLLAAGMGIHNVPQGMAIGSALLTGIAGGLSLLLFIHNIPEGMAMAIPLRIAGARPARMLFVAFLTAIPTVAGALIGAAVANISGTFLSVSFAFAAGAMLLLTVRELIPQSAALASRLISVLALAAGFAAGGTLIWTLHV